MEVRKIKNINRRKNRRFSSEEVQIIKRIIAKFRIHVAVSL